MESYEIKDCERFTRGCTMTQCFNCQKYGHIGRACRSPAACGHWAGGHQSKECNLETTGQYRRCAVCGEKGHEAWSTACKGRLAEKRKTEIAMQNRAPLYAIESQPPSFQFQLLRESTPTVTQTDEIPSTWKIVNGKKRKTHNATPSSGTPPGPHRGDDAPTWANIGIMNPENKVKALAKPVLGRPRADPVALTTKTQVTSNTAAETMEIL